MERAAALLEALMVAAAPTANAAPPSNARREIVSASRMMILPFLYARFRPLL